MQKSSSCLGTSGMELFEVGQPPQHLVTLVEVQLGKAKCGSMRSNHPELAHNHPLCCPGNKCYQTSPTSCKSAIIHLLALHWSVSRRFDVVRDSRTTPKKHTTTRHTLFPRWRFSWGGVSALVRVCFNCIEILLVVWFYEF